MFKISKICLVAVASTLPAMAMADISYYVGFGAGGNRIERDDIDLTFDEYTSGAPFGADPPYDVRPYRGEIVRVKDPEGSDFALKAFAGARFGTWFGVEAGYLNLGTATGRFDFVIPEIRVLGTQTRPPQNRQIDAETKMDGFQAYLVGFLPLGDTYEIFGKVGILAWDQDTNIVDRIALIEPVNQPGIPEIILGDEAPDGESFKSLKSSKSGTDLALGAGVNIKASEHVSMRAEFEWFDVENTSMAWAGTVSLIFGF